MPGDLEARAQGATASPEVMTAALKKFGNEKFTKEDKAAMMLRLQEMLGIPEEWMQGITIKHSTFLQKTCCTCSDLAMTFSLPRLREFRKSGKVALFFKQYRAQTSGQWVMLWLTRCVAEHMGKVAKVDYIAKLGMDSDEDYKLLDERAPPSEATLQRAIEAHVHEGDKQQINLKSVRLAMATKFACNLDSKKPFIKVCTLKAAGIPEAAAAPAVACKKPLKAAGIQEAAAGAASATRLPLKKRKSASPAASPVASPASSPPSSPPSSPEAASPPAKKLKKSEDAEKKIDLLSPCTEFHRSLVEYQKQGAEHQKQGLQLEKDFAEYQKQGVAYQEQGVQLQKDFESIMRRMRKADVPGFQLSHK
jgi:hypothetical protein